MKLLFSLLVFFILGETFAQNCNEANALLSVRKRKAGRTEYVIFTLQNPVTASHTISAASPPFMHDPSGQQVHVSGCRYKKVSFRDIIWTCKMKEFMGNTYLVRQVKNIGQFEGHIDYVIGYRCSAKSVIKYQYTTGNLTKLVVRLRY